MTARIIRVILTALLAATPLALIPGTFISHDVIPKTILILLGAALLLFLWPAWANHLPDLWARTEGRRFLILVMAEAASLLCSTVFSTQRPLSFAGTVWRRFGSAEQFAVIVIATALACAAAAQPSWIRQLFRFAIVAGGVAAVYGILQYFRIDPFLSADLYTIAYLGRIVRPPATMGHAIYFSAWLVPIVLIAAGAVSTETRSWRLIHAAVALLGCVAIILSGTRASVLAVIAGGCFLAWRKPKRNLAVAAAWIGAIIAIAAAIALSPAGANLRHRLLQWREDLGGPRLGVWRESPSIVKKYPVFGAGPETFAVEFRKIESPALSRAYPEFYNETPHNAFLDAATAQGIPGLLILVGMFAMGRRSPAIVGMLVGSLFASFVLITWMYLWCLLALVAAEDRAAAKAPRFFPNLWRVPATLTGGALAAVAILLGMQDASYARLKDAVARNDLAGAGAAYDNAIRYSFGMPGYELWSSREFATLGVALAGRPQAAEAWRAARTASALAETQGEERFSALYQSAILAIAANDFPAAALKAREAITMAPNWYKPHLLLAQILLAMGKNGEATRQAQISAELGWNQRQW